MQSLSIQVLFIGISLGFLNPRVIKDNILYSSPAAECLGSESTRIQEKLIFIELKEIIDSDVLSNTMIKSTISDYKLGQNLTYKLGYRYKKQNQFQEKSCLFFLDT